MLTIEDTELMQLINEQPQDHSTLMKFNHHPAQDLAFKAGFLLALACSISGLAIFAAFLNG